MSDGRTIWWPKDSGWWRRENVVALAEEFGADGPAVLDWLSCEAKAQNDGGVVKAGIRTVARGCFVDPETVRNVLKRAVTLVTLEEFEEREGRFTCRISGWAKDNQRGATALRVARHRAKSDEVVTVGNGPVTPETHTREKRREELHKPPTPFTADFEDWLAHHFETTAMNAPRAGTKARQHIATMFGARRSEGHELEDLKLATVGAFRDEHRREHGYYDPESVLRPTKVHKLVELGRRAEPPAPKPKWERHAKVTVLGHVHACRHCERAITNEQTNNQSGMCDECYEAHVEKLTGEVA